MDRPDLDTTESDGLAIIARRSGVLMWVTNTTDEKKAFKEFVEDVGAHSAKLDAHCFRYIPEEEMEEWADARAQDYPSW